VKYSVQYCLIVNVIYVVSSYCNSTVLMNINYYCMWKYV